jgi:Mg/Co/Ni transporter MgtE
MQTDVYTLSPETPVSTALSIAYGKHVNYLLVVDNELLAGLLSRDDLCRADKSAPVKDCMTSPVPCIGPDTTLIDAAGIMSQQELSCLAVVIDALLVGIVTRSELAEAGCAAGLADSPRAHGPVSPDYCAACGSSYDVRPCAWARYLQLCPACAATVIARRDAFPC